MAKYRVTARSFINNAIAEEGDIVEYDGNAGSALVPIEDDKPAKGKPKAAADSDAALA